MIVSKVPTVEVLAELLKSAIDSSPKMDADYAKLLDRQFLNSLAAGIFETASELLMSRVATAMLNGESVDYTAALKIAYADQACTSFRMRFALAKALIREWHYTASSRESEHPSDMMRFVVTEIIKDESPSPTSYHWGLAFEAYYMALTAKTHLVEAAR